jgi:HSP20 family protein
MTETPKIQQIPVKMYRSADRLTIAAPMPGVQPEDILVEVTDDLRVVLQAELRGSLKDIKELLLDEWSVGDYYRDLQLEDAVDGEHANVTYGNGVLVVVLPIVDQTVPATITIEKTAKDFGEYVGNSGHRQVE